MACFIVPAGEAIITTAVQKILEKHSVEVSAAADIAQKLKPLNSMLWGGSALLMFEHIWHGEVAPWFPFLTAMNSPDSTAAMLHEMGTVGVAMALVVTTAWLAGTVIASAVRSREAKAGGEGS
ncbi:MAG: hypothetical protein IJ149_00615 [Oscillospiraceae bacterium]|nr:hypothetical protein [Oscillospiraceae bacterium]